MKLANAKMSTTSNYHNQLLFKSKPREKHQFHMPKLKKCKLYSKSMPRMSKVVRQFSKLSYQKQIARNHFSK